MRSAPVARIARSGVPGSSETLPLALQAVDRRLLRIDRPDLALEAEFLHQGDGDAAKIARLLGSSDDGDRFGPQDAAEVAGTQSFFRQSS